MRPAVVGQMYALLSYTHTVAAMLLFAGVDDFIARVEMALCGFGFTGSNSIGEH